VELKLRDNIVDRSDRTAFESNQSGIETQHRTFFLTFSLKFESNQSGIETSQGHWRTAGQQLFESNQSGIETSLHGKVQVAVSEFESNQSGIETLGIDFREYARDGLNRTRVELKLGVAI